MRGRIRAVPLSSNYDNDDAPTRLQKTSHVKGNPRRRLYYNMTVFIVGFVGMLQCKRLLLITGWFDGDDRDRSRVIASRSLQQLSSGGSFANDVKMKQSLSATTIITAPLIQSSSDTTACTCELVSVDCLESIDCLDDSIDDQFATHQQLRIAMGIATRMAIKESANYAQDDAGFFSIVGRIMPPGKSMQYLGIRSWQRWIQQKSMPFNYDTPDMYINHTRYPRCRGIKQQPRQGKSCFFHDFDNPEELEPMEQRAWSFVTNSRTTIPSSISTLPDSDATYAHLMSARKEELLELARADVKQYIAVVHDRRMWSPSTTPATTTTPLADLLAFAHIMLIRFNRRPMLKAYYDARLETIPPSSDSKNNKPFPVSVHMRRADSCQHSKRDKFEKEASELDSIPQVGGKRMCYRSLVYLNALERIEAKVRRPLEVYLSTDYAGTVLQEIRRDHPEIYHRMTWKFVNVSRTTFRYASTIEVAETQHTALGETAYADMWHLSHGRAFVGHLGSRFGKVSWYLATARYNTFVPFFTVDGHSVCCEIDEACGKIKQHIGSMENCLTFVHEVLGNMDKSYWSDGSTLRKTVSMNTALQIQAKGAGGWLV